MLLLQETTYRSLKRFFGDLLPQRDPLDHPNRQAHSAQSRVYSIKDLFGTSQLLPSLQELKYSLVNFDKDRAFRLTDLFSIRPASEALNSFCKTQHFISFGT